MNITQARQALNKVLLSYTTQPLTLEQACLLSQTLALSSLADNVEVISQYTEKISSNIFGINHEIGAIRNILEDMRDLYHV